MNHARFHKHAAAMVLLLAQGNLTTAQTPERLAADEVPVAPAAAPAILDCKSHPLVVSNKAHPWCAKEYKATLAAAAESGGLQSAFARHPNVGSQRAPVASDSGQLGILAAVDARDENKRAWPMRVIPYWIDSDEDNEIVFTPDSGMVENALCQWQQATPVRFRKAVKEDSDAQVLRFFGDVSGRKAKARGVAAAHKTECVTLRGKQTYANTIMMGWCADPKKAAHNGAVIHEVGHALALKHEHLRTGRDDYIRVDFVAMREYEKAQKKAAGSVESQYYIDLKKGTLADVYPVNADYNFASIMHYSLKWFMDLQTDPETKKVKEEVVKLMNGQGVTRTDIGQSACISQGDADAIISLYKDKKDVQPSK